MFRRLPGGDQVAIAWCIVCRRKPRGNLQHAAVQSSIYFHGVTSSIQNVPLLTRIILSPMRLVRDRAPMTGVLWTLSETSMNGQIPKFRFTQAAQRDYATTGKAAV